MLIACISTALIKFCVAPESIKTVLQYAYFIVTGNSRSCNFFERFLLDAQAPCKCKH